MTIRAIFFDIDDTLFTTSEFAETARRAAIEAMIDVGLRGDPEVLYQELKEVIHEFHANYEHHFDKLLLRVPAADYAGVNPALIIAAGVVAYHETKAKRLAPFPGVRELMQALMETDLVRGIITHGSTIKQAEKIVRLGIAPYLSPDALFISDQIGISKPNVKLYQRALERCRIAADESIYVGDNPLSDIDPPNALGMHTIRLRQGKHASTEARTAPDHEITRFSDLARTLREAYGIPV